jgi:hypothetical protein
MRTMDENNSVFTKVKDVPGPQLNEFINLYIEHICEKVLARPNLSEKERNWFNGEVETLTNNITQIIASGDEQQREAALRAVLSALFTGYYHSGGPQILQEVNREFQKERTKQANSARRRPDIQKIIDARVQAAWQASPELMNRPYATADAICATVIYDVNQLSSVPDTWKIKNQNHASDAELRKGIDRIRRQIERMYPKDK